MDRTLNQGREMKQEVSTQVVHAAPAVAGTVIAGLTLNEWVAILTGIYVVLQAAYLVWKWVREARSKRGHP
jgi:hypothetical protein